MQNSIFVGAILCGILLGVAADDSTCSSVGGCPQASNDHAILLQSRLLVSSNETREANVAERAILFENGQGKEEGDLLGNEGSLRSLWSILSYLFFAWPDTN